MNSFARDYQILNYLYLLEQNLVINMKQDLHIAPPSVVYILCIKVYNIFFFLIKRKQFYYSEIWLEHFEAFCSCLEKNNYFLHPAMIRLCSVDNYAQSQYIDKIPITHCVLSRPVLKHSTEYRAQQPIVSLPWSLPSTDSIQAGQMVGFLRINY